MYFVLRQWPAAWWALAGGGYAVVAIALVNLAPVVLLPLFFTFKPLEKDALRDRLTALALKAGTRIMGVYEWTLSDRTRKANAALTGMGHTRRILLSDTLLSEYSDDEIEVILAHELAHHVHRDIWTSVVFDMALTFAGFFAAHLALRRAVPLFGFDGIADPAAMPVLLLTAGAIGLCVKPAMNAVSRAHERRADSYALKMTENPSAFITAMRRLGQQNLAEDSPSKLVQAFFYTHPPLEERVRAAEYWACRRSVGRYRRREGGCNGCDRCGSVLDRDGPADLKVVTTFYFLRSTFYFPLSTSTFYFLPTTTSSPIIFLHPSSAARLQ